MLNFDFFVSGVHPVLVLVQLVPLPVLGLHSVMSDRPQRELGHAGRGIQVRLDFGLKHLKNNEISFVRFVQC